MPEPKETVLASTDVPANAEQGQKVCPSEEKRAGPDLSCEEGVHVTAGGGEKKGQLPDQVAKSASEAYDVPSSPKRDDCGPRFKILAVI